MKKVYSDLNYDDIERQISFLRRNDQKMESDPTYPDCNNVYDVTPMRTIQTVAKKISQDILFPSPLREQPDYGEGGLQEVIDKNS